MLSPEKINEIRTNALMYVHSCHYIPTGSESYIAGATAEAEKASVWISVEDRLPENGQTVDIWEMPSTERLKTNLSLKGTEYGNKHHNETHYSGWRSTNYKFSIEHDNDGQMKCFTKCVERYFNIEIGGPNYKKLIVENGEVTHWQPIPAPPQ